MFDMIERITANTIKVCVAMDMANAQSLTVAAKAHIAPRGIDERTPTPVPSQLCIDLSAVSTADSAALAVMLEWMRIARTENCELQFCNIPGNIQALIDLYGIGALLPVATAAPANADSMH